MNKKEQQLNEAIYFIETLIEEARREADLHKTATLKYFNSNVSKKGWGTTVNVVVPLPYIPRRICRLLNY